MPSLRKVDNILQDLPWRKLAPLNLKGRGVNPHWCVPRTLHSLIGELELSMKIIEAWEPLLEERLRTKEELTQELGFATVAVMVTAIAAEKALKSLISQTQPHQEPPRTHSLADLFNHLDPATQQQLNTEFESMPSSWQEYWGGTDIREVFQIADKCFVDWRYTMEPGNVTGGIPKGVVRATVAVYAVCVSHL